MVDGPDGRQPLRDWLRYDAGADVWPSVVSSFYTKAGGVPVVADYFRDADMEALQRHFLAALMLVSGQGVTVGVLRRLHREHAGVRSSDGTPITPQIWDAVISTLAACLTEHGVPPAALTELAITVAPIRDVIVAEPEVSGNGRVTVPY